MYTTSRLEVLSLSKINNKNTIIFPHHYVICIFDEKAKKPKHFSSLSNINFYLILLYLNASTLKISQIF